MEKKVVEHNELIANRVPPGDRWTLVGDVKKRNIPKYNRCFRSIFPPDRI